MNTEIYSFSYIMKDGTSCLWPGSMQMDAFISSTAPNIHNTWTYTQFGKNVMYARVSVTVIQTMI